MLSRGNKLQLPDSYDIKRVTTDSVTTIVSSYNHSFTFSTAAKSLQSCPILCDRIDGSPPGYPIPGILQARTLEWVAISFSNARKWKVKVKLFSRVRLIATPWTAADQAPPSMGFSRQEYWSGLHWLPQHSVQYSIIYWDIQPYYKHRLVLDDLTQL